MTKMLLTLPALQKCFLSLKTAWTVFVHDIGHKHMYKDVMKKCSRSNRQLNKESIIIVLLKWESSPKHVQAAS